MQKKTSTIFLQTFPLAIILLLIGCANFGGGILYKTPEKINVKTLGYIDLYQDSVLNNIFKQTSEIYRSTVISSFKEYGMDSIKFINEKIDYKQPDTNAIRSICGKYNLDGLIISNLYFTNVNIKYKAFLVTVAKEDEWFAQVFQKVFSRNGTLLIKAGHDTKRGNYRLITPTPDIAVRDGTKGAVKQVCSAIGLKIKKHP